VRWCSWACHITGSAALAGLSDLDACRAVVSLLHQVVILEGVKRCRSWELAISCDKCVLQCVLQCVWRLQACHVAWSGNALLSRSGTSSIHWMSLQHCHSNHAKQQRHLAHIQLMHMLAALYIMCL
jgi:hypothetical protein